MFAFLGIRHTAHVTPQVWALYKEVLDYYDKGMKVPDDVTLLLCDDNWGFASLSAGYVSDNLKMCIRDRCMRTFLLSVADDAPWRARAFILNL